MFCSPCQIWSQDTPFISFVTLVSKNFAAYLRFLKWKPFLAFHFPSHNGVWNAQAAHNYDARVTINLDIAWLRLIQLLLVPPRAAEPHSRRRGGLSIVAAGEELLEDLSRSGLWGDSYHTQLGFASQDRAKNLFMLCDCVWYSTYFTL